MFLEIFQTDCCVLIKTVQDLNVITTESVQQRITPPAVFYRMCVWACVCVWGGAWACVRVCVRVCVGAGVCVCVGRKIKAK